MDKNKIDKTKILIKRYMEEKKIDNNKLGLLLNIDKKTVSSYLQKNRAMPKVFLKKVIELPDMQEKTKKYILDILNTKDKSKKKVIQNQVLEDAINLLIENVKKIKEETISFDGMEKELKNKRIQLEKIEQEIKIKRFQYEKLERTSGTKSKITWAAIDIQKVNSEKITEITSLYSLADKDIQKSTYTVLKQLSLHYKVFLNAIEKLLHETDIVTNDEMVLEEENDKMTRKNAYSKYLGELPQKNFSDFDEEDKVKIITCTIGKRLPRLLSDLNIYINPKKEMTSRQISLLLNGKNDYRENYRMKDYVGTYGKFFKDLHNSIFECIKEILEEVIDDMTEYTKNSKRREKFFRTFDSYQGQMFIFTIAITSLGEFLIKEYGKIENGRYLEQVLLARKRIAKKAKEIYKAMNRGEITKEQADLEFQELIDITIQDSVNFDLGLHEAIKFEEDLLEICTIESIEGFIYEMVEDIRIKSTGQLRIETW